MLHRLLRDRVSDEQGPAQAIMTSRIPTVGIVVAVLLGLAMSNMNRRALIVTLWASMILGLAACGSEATEQAQVVSVPPTSVPTTSPLSVPSPTPITPPTSTALPEATSTPLPTALPAPTAAPPASPTPTLAPAPTAASDVATASADAAPTVDADAVIETPTPVPTPTAQESETDEDSSAPGSDVGAESTPVAETPTAVVAASSEPPLECFDRDVQVYRAHVDGVDALSFEGGRVYCTGAGTNAVSAALSYRHSSGLVVQRNGDYIFNDAGTAYIPYSGSLHFCKDGQSASAPVRADTVPALLVVIDNEAQRQVAQGASGPAAFTGGSSQC